MTSSVFVFRGNFACNVSKCFPLHSVIRQYGGLSLMRRKTFFCCSSVLNA